MTYLLLALATYVVLTLVGYVSETLQYGVRLLVAILVGVVGVGMTTDWGEAHLGLGVAGAAILFVRLDNLMFARRGESEAAMTIARRNRPQGY